MLLLKVVYESKQILYNNIICINMLFCCILGVVNPKVGYCSVCINTLIPSNRNNG
jgi:hypothetical protein